MSKVYLTKTVTSLLVCSVSHAVIGCFIFPYTLYRLFFVRVFIFSIIPLNAPKSKFTDAFKSDQLNLYTILMIFSYSDPCSRDSPECDLIESPICAMVDNKMESFYNRCFYEKEVCFDPTITFVGEGKCPPALEILDGKISFFGLKK